MQIIMIWGNILTNGKSRLKEEIKFKQILYLFSVLVMYTCIIIIKLHRIIIIDLYYAQALQ